MVNPKEVDAVLARFGLPVGDCLAERITTGHINFTYRVEVPSRRRSFILQRINRQVFHKPEIVSANIRLAADYLHKLDPDYLFPEPVQGVDGRDLQYDESGEPWRLFPFLSGTYTVNVATSPAQAYAAAAAFGRFNRLLSNLPIACVGETIPRFHDLAWRWQQFTDACERGVPARLAEASPEISQAKRFSTLVDQYRACLQSGALVKRVFHNDTKINNLLWWGDRHEPACVIDLDTLMPGYFIYDLGDLVRTLVSPVSEEERDVTRIAVRDEYYEAVVNGYTSAMEPVLTGQERQLVPFAGKMMTFIMALRFLSDFLLGDVYYQTHYPGQNLVRARNQLTLLEQLCGQLPD
ncbi:MAG TPA: aminoglycoside phosphotransferase family protein [Cytophagales bacterium]|nr:aminoglycoside phosphotransferase family protein [Cytophagales bacterium]